MKYIIVHDEETRLQTFANQLASFELPIQMKSFNTQDEVISYILQTKPSCIFIDPTIFGKTGLKVIKKIKETMPHVYIVIVSRVSDYAVDAFELKVIDYIMLP